jgi:hypothetical protein
MFGRWFHQKAVSRQGIIVAALGTAALLATGGTAIAGKPEIHTFTVDDVETIDCGGFALEDHVFGTIKGRFTESPDGSARDLSTVRLRHVVTNPQTGASLTSNDVGAEKVSIHADGSATVIEVGLISRFRIPGQGLIAHESGKLVLFLAGPGDAEPDVLFEAGPKDDLDAAACEALAV